MTKQANPDKVENFHGATIQHGPLNNRIYLMNLNQANPKLLIGQLSQLANQKGYTKIFAKVPHGTRSAFLNAGYRQEAAVPGFFNGKDEAVFLGWYPADCDRADADTQKLDAVIETAQSKAENRASSSIPSELFIRKCNEHDVEEMSRVFAQVFPSYPFPIQNPEYVLETMRSHVSYFCVEDKGCIVAISSAEMDEHNRNVEMTDFATLPQCRGQRLASHLLTHMDAEMPKKGIKTAYTISRAVSYPMNITFATAGYTFGGVLINNTNISGQIESMTVWYKAL